MDIKHLAEEMSERLRDPFDYGDMNRGDIDWQAAYDAAREELSEGDLPCAFVAFLDVISENGAESASRPFPKVGDGVE